MQTLAQCLKAWKSNPGLEELWAYSRKVAFVHDDSLPEVLDPEDVLSYHPLLLRPDCTVVPDLGVLSGRFGEALADQIGGIGGLCPASRPTPSSLRNIALVGFDRPEDALTARQCKSSSVFQCDRRDLENYDFRHIPPIIERQGSDNVELQNRIVARQALNRARIPTPYGRQVSSKEELSTLIASYDYPIAVRSSSRTTKIDSAIGLDRFLAAACVFPLWVEKWENSLFSPNAQVLRSKGRSYPLFVSKQILNGIVHVGNTLGDIPPAVSSRCLELTQRFADSLTDYTGIIGIDFIVRPTGDIMAVDVNARYNSSTIPFWWLLTTVDLKNTTIGTFRQKRGSNIDLNSIPSPTSRQNGFKSLAFSPILNTPFRRVTGYHEMLWR